VSVTSLLSVTGVETSYGPVRAVQGVSFSVDRGKVVAVLGANGAGKTTLMRTISGTLVCSAGEVHLDGRAIQGFDPDRIVTLGLSHVPEGRQVFPHLTVSENLRMGAYIRTDPDGVETDLAAVFDYFPVLRERQAQRAGLLSGGEQQMLALSRALMARPRMLLLDEPSLGLSPRLVKEIFRIVKRINAERDVTILLVEQNAAMALDVSDEAHVLENGRIVVSDSSATLRARTDIQDYYLGGQGSGDSRPRPRRLRAWL